MDGKLIIFSAPSGAGKTTIVKYLLEQDLNLEFSVSATCRPRRHTETDGKDYYFLSLDEFKRKVENGEFLEWEEVYEGICYGTLKSEVERICSKGKHVIFDVDVVGGSNIKKFYGDKALAIFVQPPSVDELRNRLIARSTDSMDVIQKRVAKAAYELTFANPFDCILLNEKLSNPYKNTKNRNRHIISGSLQKC